MSTEPLTVADIPVEVVRKDIKHLHIGVYPPTGRVRVSCPQAMTDDAVRAAVIVRLGWVKRQQTRYQAAKRQPVRRYVSGETHYFLGRAYRLRVRAGKRPARVRLDGSERLVLEVPANASTEARGRLLDRWYRQQLTDALPPLLDVWGPRLGADSVTWRLRRMRTRWATINPEKKIITLNPEIIKQPPEALEYVLVHELVHLSERTHNDRFAELLDSNMPDWRARQRRMNQFPLTHEDWTF